MLHGGRARAEPQKPQPVPAVTELSGRNRRNVTTRRSGPQQCHIATVRTGPARSAAGPGGTRTAANRACRLTQVLGARRRRKLRLSGMSPGPSRRFPGCPPSDSRDRRDKGRARDRRTGGGFPDHGRPAAERVRPHPKPTAHRVSTLEGGGGRVGREDGLTGGGWMRSEDGGVDERGG